MSRDLASSYTSPVDALQDSIDVCTADAIAKYTEIDPEVEGVVDRIASINKHVAKVFEETLAGHGLTHGEYKVLLRLAVVPADRRLSAGDLTRSLMLSSGGMTNRLDRLEEAGLLRRLPDPNDRRGVLLELTEAGTDLIDRAVTDEASKEIDLFGVLSPEELASLNRLLRVVLRSLEDRFGQPTRVSDAAVAAVGVTPPPGLVDSSP